jgi:membrane protein YdbS with pleckstrin-like domain
VAKHPEWTPPDFEFETEHRSTERVREWGLAILLGIPIAVGFLVTGLYFVLVGPVGWTVAALELLGIVVVMVLTTWGHSRWRMRRSLARRSSS